MVNVKVVKELPVSVILEQIIQVEPQSLLSVAADEKVPQIVRVEHGHQGEGEREGNAESLEIFEK